MTSYAGFVPLLRLALRRDRIKLPVWLLSIGVATFYFGNALLMAYPDARDLAAIASFMNSPAGVVMSGPGYGWDPPTHATAFAGAYAPHLLLAAAFMGILLVVRHTRADEEPGRLELVWAVETQAVMPLVVLTLIGAGLVTASVVRFQRRDVVAD